jgi:hypothetical protein
MLKQSNSTVEFRDGDSSIPTVLQPAAAAAAASCCYCCLLQVPGCGHDLSQDRPYCQRLGVCFEHIKAPAVIIAGYACRSAARSSVVDRRACMHALSSACGVGIPFRGIKYASCWLLSVEYFK